MLALPILTNDSPDNDGGHTSSTTHLIPSNSGYQQFQLQGQAMSLNVPNTSQIVAAATGQSVSNDSKTTIMLAAKKK
jgi:hypothetical protein